jgi:hypothetical protein
MPWTLSMEVCRHPAGMKRILSKVLYSGFVLHKCLIKRLVTCLANQRL